MAAPANAAIVIPIQKVNQLKQDEKCQSSLKDVAKWQTDQSNSLESSRTNQVKINSKSSSLGRGKTCSISKRQQNAENKRIAWARNASSTTVPKESLTKSYYRTPSTISRTNMNSDSGSVQSLNRSTQLGTLPRRTLPTNGGATRTQSKSFMKPTSASVAKCKPNKP